MKLEAKKKKQQEKKGKGFKNVIKMTPRTKMLEQGNKIIRKVRKIVK